MTRLIDRLVGRAQLPDPQQAAGWVPWVWSSSANQEPIQRTFQSYSIDGYQSNPTVFAVVLQRINYLSQADFAFQDDRTRKLFTTADLRLLEEPWPNGTTADLIAQMEQHVSLSGNAFVRRTGNRLVVMRPDWVNIISEVVVEGEDPRGELQTHREVVGYAYTEGGIESGNEPVLFDVEDVAHWAPIPDPMANWRGMSWMTPVLREINADSAMTKHRKSFFDNAGTPNMILKYGSKLQQAQLERIREQWRARYSGSKGAGETVVLDEGADLTVVGSSFESMRFNDVQAAGEVRIAQAAGVPAIVAGLTAGLDSNAYNVYKVALQAFINGTGSALWQSMCASLAKLVDVPANARLWWDTTNMPALREDEKDRAEAAQGFAAALSTLITAGFTPESASAALTSNDMTQLKHSGLVSVQLLQPGAVPPQQSGGAPAKENP